MIGLDKRVIEPANGLAIPPASGVTVGWVTLTTWTRDEAEDLHLLGPSWLYVHIGWDAGDPSLGGLKRRATFPTDIKTQWLRSSGDGLTQRQAHNIGTAVTGSSGISGPEYLSLDDFPMRVQVWQMGGVLLLRKIIAVIDSVDSRIGQKIAP